MGNSYNLTVDVQGRDRCDQNRSQGDSQDNIPSSFHLDKIAGSGNEIDLSTTDSLLSRLTHYLNVVEQHSSGRFSEQEKADWYKLKDITNFVIECLRKQERENSELQSKVKELEQKIQEMVKVEAKLKNQVDNMVTKFDHDTLKEKHEKLEDKVDKIMAYQALADDMNGLRPGKPDDINTSSAVAGMRETCADFAKSRELTVASLCNSRENTRVDIRKSRENTDIAVDVLIREIDAAARI